jgi:aspartate/methionine/tyrosine aminotransferase
MAAVLSPGDEVLIESPTYELLTSTASHLGASVATFPRALASGWRLDPAVAAARVSSKTRLAIVTDLHNPSGAPTSEADIEALSAAVPLLLVDEVYRELTFGDARPRTAFREDGNIIVTSSLTKAYGLSGLRCGWILAPLPLAERMRRLNDLFGVKPPHIAERLALAAIRRLELFRARASSMIEPNRAAYRACLGGHPALEQHVFADSTTVFPRIRCGDADGFVEWLKTDFETRVVPGRFFGAADHIRVGLGGEPAATREGLTRLTEALEIWTQKAQRD